MLPGLSTKQMDECRNDLGLLILMFMNAVRCATSLSCPDP